MEEHYASFQRVQGIENEAPVVATTLFHLKRLVNVVGAGVGEFRRLRLGDPDGLGSSALDGGEAAIPRDHVEPG
jgi:hypothetical protein